MKKVYYVGLETHKESIAMAIAQEAGEVRAYGQIVGTLEAEPCGQDARATGSSSIRG